MKPNRMRNGLGIVLLLTLFLGLLVTGQSDAEDWRTMTDLPKVDLFQLPGDRRAAALEILRNADCPCGRNMKIAQCLVEDPNCPRSPGIATRIVQVTSESASALQAKLRWSIIEEGKLGQDEYDEQMFLQPPSDGETEYYYFVGTSRPDAGSTFIEFPRYLQYVVELMRGNAAGEFPRQDLLQAEQTVARQLDVVVDRGKTFQRKFSELQQLQQQGFEILENALVRYAQSRGWRARLQNVYKGPGAVANVTFAGLVPGSQVGYAAAELYESLTFMGLQSEREQWKYLGTYDRNGLTRPVPVGDDGKVVFGAWPPGGVPTFSPVQTLEADVAYRVPF